MTGVYKCEIPPYLVVTYHHLFSKAEYSGTKKLRHLMSDGVLCIYALFIKLSCHTPPLSASGPFQQLSVGNQDSFA